jgi:hypothetical protein
MISMSCLCKDYLIGIALTYVRWATLNILGILVTGNTLALA